MKSQVVLNDKTLAISAVIATFIIFFVGLGFWLVSDSHIAKGTVAIATFTAMLALLALVTAIYAYKAAKAAERQTSVSRRMLLDSTLPVIKATAQFIEKSDLLIIRFFNIGNGPALYINGHINYKYDGQNFDEIEYESLESLSNWKESSGKFRFKMTKQFLELSDWFVDIQWQDLYGRHHWSKLEYSDKKWRQSFSQQKGIS